MGVVSEPPGQVEIAMAKELVMKELGAVRVAQLETVSRNVRMDGTNAQQDAFRLTIYEIYGIAERAQIKGSDALKTLAKELAQAVDAKVLLNPTYDKFKTWVAATPDPLIP